jgi:hypothetical protein
MKNKHFLTFALLTASILFFLNTTSAFAQCVIPITEGQSYTENFESGTMECWTVEATGSATWAVMNGTASSVAAFQNATAGDEARLISPTFDLSGIGSATFSFGYAMMGLYPPYDELTVSYRSSETDSWHVLGSFSFSDWSGVYDETYDLPDISATYQISFLGHSNGGYYIFIDDIEIAGSGGCARPVNLQVTEITSSSALLGWSTTGNEESWVLELNGNLRTVNAQPFLMEELASQTEYILRVKANCGDGLESEWSYPITFKTLCDAIIVTDNEPYFDDFEASEDFMCWQNEITSGEDSWVVDPGYLILNNTAFFIWMGGEAWLISAPLDITAVTSPTLTFKHKQPHGDYNNVDELSVWYGTSTSDYWHLLGEYTTVYDDWETVTYTLPDPSTTYYIAFKAKANDANGVYVDDVRVGNSQNDAIAETTALKAVVSPNPTPDKVVVETNAINGNIVVYDLSGRKMATAMLCKGRAELDLSGFAKGIYMAQVNSTNGATTIKLVKE